MCDLRIPINYRLQDLAIFMHFGCNLGQDYGNFTFFSFRRGIFFSNSWLSRIIWSNFERNMLLQKKMVAFFLHAPFWLILLVTMLFYSLTRNQIRFTVIPDWVDFIYLATFQTFFSENSPTSKCRHFLTSKGYSF